jgi:hypothetical protein
MISAAADAVFKAAGRLSELPFPAFLRKQREPSLMPFAGRVRATDGFVIGFVSDQIQMPVRTRTGSSHCTQQK